jgi:hypothetical protein
MGLEVDQDLSPALEQKTVRLATRLPSFEAARDSIAETLEVILTTKRVERVTERVGRRRVAERQSEVAAWDELQLVAKLAAPEGVKAPAVACVSMDGGRLQRCDLPDNAKSHWCETKIGALMELGPNPHLSDPCPQVPDKFLELGCVDELAREIKGSAPKNTPFQRAETPQSAADPASVGPAEPPGAVVAEVPAIESRDVVASLDDSATFGKQLAMRAWALGFAGAWLKAFVGDGQSSNWGVWERHFKHLEFIPILDFIHALTYVYSAASAGRSADVGWSVYVRWITWVWQGQVSLVIEELARRAEELGTPTPSTSDTDPSSIVAETLTYLRNQQSRMNYPQYRQLGLPITSSPMESTVKQINYRVKGSEKFWTRAGGDAILQLRADQLSDTAPLDVYWASRPQKATGTRSYATST